jgi:hypothetical protein
MQPENLEYCPECETDFDPQQMLLHRRGFIRAAGGTAAGLIALGGMATGGAGLLSAAPAEKKPKPPEKKAKPAEDMIKELYAGLSADQKKTIVLPWDHGYDKGKALPTRMRMYNNPILGLRIGQNYTKAQQELVKKILYSICSGDEGYKQISRNGTFDGTRSFEACGALIFGEPTDKKQFAWVFTGHHLTVRCDGNSEPGAAFGGPMYYGHSPNGYSARNIFNYQTKAVMSVFDALSEKQRKVAVLDSNPGEGEPSIRFRPKDKPKPGLSYGEMNKKQQELVAKVMREVLSPYRKEDADEVMQIIKANGGLEKIHLAFYKAGSGDKKQPWSFWRLEGPGFVWNYRVLPHVHTYVSISSKV